MINSGPTMDPLAEQAEYDPQSAAISSAYVSAFNDYVRKTLNYGQGLHYNPEIGLWKYWDFSHQPPGESHPIRGDANVDQITVPNGTLSLFSDGAIVLYRL